MTLEDIEEELDNYQRDMDYQKKKALRTTLILLGILIIVILCFIFALMNYHGT